MHDVGSTGMLMVGSILKSYVISLSFFSVGKKKKPCYASCFAHCIICSKGSVMVLIYSWKNFFSFNVSLFQIVGGMPLLELNRVLRPGGYFIWSATPVYRDNSRDQSVWNGLKPVFLCFYNSNARNVIICSVISFLY